jgi:U3 small nucleolar RNA-associated protein 10
MEDQAGRIIEWLVRRFRINEFNVPDILVLFLPYHESPHFAKMVSILSIEPNTAWSFMAGFKVSGKAIPRSALVTEMLHNRGLARFVVAILPDTLSDNNGVDVHRTLAYFNTAVMMEFISRAEPRHLDPAALAFIVPALTALLEVKERVFLKDLIVSTFVFFWLHGF